MRCSKISRVIGQGQGSGGGGEITRIVGQAWSDPSAHSPPLPAVPGSGPPSSPPESSSLRAAPGAERAPLPAPTATGSPKTWPARAATPRQAAPGSDLRESRSERSITKRLVVQGWALPLAGLAGHALKLVAFAGLSQVPPLFYRQSETGITGLGALASGAVPSAPLLPDFRGPRFPITAPRSRAVETRALAPPLPRGRHPGDRTATQAPPLAIPGGEGGASSRGVGPTAEAGGLEVRPSTEL